jgi:hypothetical protein
LPTEGKDDGIAGFTAGILAVDVGSGGFAAGILGIDAGFATGIRALEAAGLAAGIWRAEDGAGRSRLACVTASSSVKRPSGNSVGTAPAIASIPFGTFIPPSLIARSLYRAQPS